VFWSKSHPSWLHLYAAPAAALLACASSAHALSNAGMTQFNTLAHLSLATSVDEPEARLLSLTLDTGVPKETREQAARSLINDNAPSESVTMVAQAIHAATKPASIEPLLLAIAGLSLIPDALIDSLTHCADTHASLAPRIARLLAKSESRLSLPWLVQHASSAPSQPLRLSARQSLITLAGPTAPVPDDAASWDQWLTRIQSISDAEWNLLRLRIVAAAANQSSQLLTRTVSDLAQERRRLYLALPATDRATLLNEWLTDTAPTGRGVALELMLRELAAGTSIDPTLAGSITPLLRSDLSAERADAARVLARLAPAGAGAAIAAQLNIETHTSAIDAMLSSLVAWPGELSVADLSRWLAWSTPAHPATLDIALGKLRLGELNDDPIRSLVLDAARARLQVDPTPAACQLMVLLGTDDDRIIVSRLLQDPRPAMRYAAAEALVSESGFVVPIAIAAANDPALVTLATRSFVLHQPTIESFRLLFAMGGDAQQRGQLLSWLASMMPATDVQQTIPLIGPDPTLLDRVLTTLENPNRILSESQDDAQTEAIARGLLVLAQARLEMGKPDAALAAMQTLPAIDVYADPLAYTRTLLACWLGLGRLDDARNLKADAAAWLDAITVIKDQPRAERQRILDAFTADFGATLEPTQKSRLDTLLARLSAEAAAPAPTSPTAPNTPTTPTGSANDRTPVDGPSNGPPSSSSLPAPR
jgi:hypothetical protein